LDPDAVLVGECGQGMCVTDGMMIVNGKEAVLGVNIGHPIVTNGDSVAQLCESDALFPSYFREDLLLLHTYIHTYNL